MRIDSKVVSNHHHHIVEAILDSRIHRRRLQYLVRWEGLGPEENTWEPVENLLESSAVEQAIQNFHVSYPSRPRRERKGDSVTNHAT